jgi:hypothetical protein
VISDNRSTNIYVNEYIEKTGIISHYVPGDVINKEYRANHQAPIGRRFLPHNIYFNMVENELLPGFILYLDSDDFLKDDEVVEKAMNIVDNEDDMYFFNVEIGSLNIPQRPQEIPQLNDISGSGFIFHTKFYKYAKWNPWSGSDYDVCMKIFQKTNNKIFANYLTIVKCVKAGKGERKDDY